MIKTTVFDAKTNFSKLCEQVAAGDELVVTRYGKPWVKVVPFEPGEAKLVFGLCKGMGSISDDFDAEEPSVTGLFEAE